MSDTFKVQVPLQGSNVTRESDGPPAGQSGSVVDGVYTPPEGGRFAGGVYKPPEQKQSLHQVGHRIREAAARRRGETELVTEWQEDHRGNGRFIQTHRPVQRQPEPPAPPDPLTRQVGQLTEAVTMLAQHQLGVEPDKGPQMPNPEAFNFYDEADSAEYWRLQKEFIDATVQREKEAALRPHQDAIQQNEIVRYYNEAANEYRDHPNFREIEAAAQYALRHSDGKTSLKQIFADAVDPAKARPGWAGNIHTPKQLRGKLGATATHRALLRKEWGV